MHFPKVTLLSSLFISLGPVHPIPLSRDTGKATFSISSRVNAAGIGNIAERDRARILSLKYPSLRSNTPVNVSNGVFFYSTQVGVGTPPTYHTLLVDTGSSNTWVGASQPYVATNSSVNTNNSVYVGYGSGAFSGEEWYDNVTFPPDLVISQQSIGVASWTAGISGFDGILGLGPVDLTRNTVNNVYEVQTVPDNLFTQNKISQEVLGIFFPPVSQSDINGTLTFGGYDNSMTTSSVNYVPLTTTQPAAQYWGINQSISYGNSSILASAAGIVDTGTTLILIASDAFQTYQSLTNATLDSATGLLTVTSAQYASLQTVWFNIGGTPYGLTPNAQIWPRSLNTAIGGKSGAIYLVVSDIGFSSGSGFDFCNGYSFLQRFYSIFDTTNQRFGIAKTIYTNSSAN